MNDRAMRLRDLMHRLEETDKVQPLPAAVHVLVAPPLGRVRVWAAFHLPAACLRAMNWECDYLACQRTESSYRAYEQEVGMSARAAYRRLTQTGARVTRSVRRKHLEAAIGAPEMQALVIVGHRVGDGIELADSVMPGSHLISLLQARQRQGPFCFVWVVCESEDWRREVVSVAPDILPFSPPLRMRLDQACGNLVRWIEELDGQTPFALAQQRALVRQWPSDHQGVNP
jgi:hypothetical protein